MAVRRGQENQEKKKNRSEKKKRIKRIKILKNRSAWFGFGFINMKLKK